MTEHIGYIVLCLGGIMIVCLGAILFAGLIAEAWIWASDKWRRICRAESLIHEYKRHRKEYLAWRQENSYAKMDGGEADA